jgi:hypothetical protein
MNSKIQKKEKEKEEEEEGKSSLLKPGYKKSSPLFCCRCCPMRESTAVSGRAHYRVFTAPKHFSCEKQGCRARVPCLLYMYV